MSDTSLLPSIQRIKRDGTFNRFLDNQFDPNRFTSEVMSSNCSGGQGMDIGMCLKMLSMYLDTIDCDLREVVLQNQDRLFNEIGDIKIMKTDFESITKQVDTITARFSATKGIVDSSCKSINENATRLSNYNSVILSLRQIAVFRSGIKKIKGFLMEENPSQRSWMRAQKTLQEIEKIFLEGYLANISCLKEDVEYYNHIRVKIMEQVFIKK